MPSAISKSIPASESHGDTNTSVTLGKIVAMDDDPMSLRILGNHLSKAGYTVETAANGVSGLELIDETTAIALVDLRMPDLDGFDVLRHLQQHHPNVQVIVLTASHEVSDAVEAMREGAFQFITKPFAPDQILVFVEKAMFAWQIASENRGFKEFHNQSIPARVVESQGDMHSRLMQQVEQIAALDSSVFIGGETGTGKSTVARMIHQKSKRGNGPFVTVNCASLPRDLIQSELFGHAKGAFTGAVSDRVGHAEMAHNGTLFLDEIGDLPIDLQPKLLTFLQDRTVQRLGGTAVKQVNVRLITATHRDLTEMCREGTFRQDLYFRLMVLSLELPALRFRYGDFESIANGILASTCERQSLSPKLFSATAMEMLKAHPWPGNIRELENVVERAIAFSKGDTVEPPDLLFSNVALDRRSVRRTTNQVECQNGGGVVGRDSASAHVAARSNPIVQRSTNGTKPDSITENRPQQSDVRESQPLAFASHANPAFTAAIDMDRLLERSSPIEATPPVAEYSQVEGADAEQGYRLVGKTLEEIERDAIIQTMKSLSGNKAKTARVLGISEKSIYNKMRRLKIDF